MQISEKQLIIFDTDMDTDCDDVGALAMLLEAHKAQKIQLLSIISDSVCKYAAPCCEWIAKYYGVNVSVGTVYADDYLDSEENRRRFERYRRYSKHCDEIGRSYNRIFAEELGKLDKSYSSAKRIYRETLAKAEDGSVTVLCVGMLTGVYEALASEADEISSLSGKELFARKVKRVITMGNPNCVNDFNWGMDAVATEGFFKLCPSPIYISPNGEDVITGAHLTVSLDKMHPLRRAYEIWLGKKNMGRSSWDLIATLYAINPYSEYLVYKELNDFQYSAEKKSVLKQESRNRRYNLLHINRDIQEIERVLNAWMLGRF